MWLAKYRKKDYNFLQLQLSKADKMYSRWSHLQCNINTKARAFHDREARAPDLSGCKNIHEQVTKFIVERLRSQGPSTCIDIQYVGSNYEGTKVLTPVSKPEFDLMIIRKPQGVVRYSESTVPGFYILYENGDKLNCETVYNRFKGDLQRAINSLSIEGLEITIQDHRPAVALVVVFKYGEYEYSVDMVPSYRLLINGQTKYFVPKEPKVGRGERSLLEQVSIIKPYLWFESHAVDEKNKLVSADADNGCRREAYRVCKVIRDRERWPLSSYILKNAVFEKMRENVIDDEPYPWRHEDLGDRVEGILRGLSWALLGQSLPCYFNHKINLVKHLKFDTCFNLAMRISLLIAQPSLLFRPSTPVEQTTSITQSVREMNRLLLPQPERISSSTRIGSGRHRFNPLTRR